MSKILIVAEAGISHGGNMEIAKEMIRQAKTCGAEIWKTQLFDVDKFYSPDWEWYEVVKKTQLSKEQFLMLADYCQKLDIEILASAHDLERLAWCEEVGMRRHKVATSMRKNKELIDAMIATGKQVLISTNIPVDYYNPYQTKYPNYKVLYCVPKYPTPLSNLQLQYVDFKHEFSGFSDHTIGIEASMIAMARGAKVIEKHFCLKRDNSNPDMICSITPSELRELVNFARKVEEIL